jgi:hypothetical protein
LEEIGVLDVSTEAIVSLERHRDSISFAKKFRPLREKMTRMANRPLPVKIDCATCIIAFGISGKFENTNRGKMAAMWKVTSKDWH